MSRAGSLAADGFASTDPVRQARKSHRFRWLRTMPFIIRICALILLGFVLVALAAPVLAPVDPADQDLLGRLQPPVGFGGSWDHPLGTDQLGRDVLSRTLYGARFRSASAWPGWLSASRSACFCGLIAGVRPGLVDDGLMFLVDVQLALPFIVIALIAIALFGSTLTVLIIVMASPAGKATPV
ncbi:MAG: hypothetical protein R2849_23370 [Thermomicrobiales bacterium]